jgi:hypothetical protein
MENAMTQFFRLSVMAVALLGSASVAAAQDVRARAETWRHYNDGNQYHNTVPTGPYFERRRLREVPARPSTPFTWEEKRHFDMSNGEQG